MEVFLALLIKIAPLYTLILLGYIAGKKLNAKKETIASILIYIVVPVVIFNSIIQTKLTFEILLLPFIFFVFCSLMCLLFYNIGKNFFKDSTKNLLGLSAGTANTGYFGIPVAIELFGEEIIGIMIIAIIGFTIFENSLGFYITARGNYSFDEALKRLFKLPTIYAFLAGVVINSIGFHPSDYYINFSKNFIGAYTVFGMMIIGLGLADMKSFKLDPKFLTLAFGAKFVAWPLLMLLFVYIDNHFLYLFDEPTHKVMFLLSIVPLAANNVAFATELKAQPEKASSAVFLSTLIALVYIPLLTTVLF